MLTIEVKLNGEIIAEAQVTNTCDGLPDVSDYKVVWVDIGSRSMGIPHEVGKFQVCNHRRRQTPWALVAKVVVGILDKLAGDPRDMPR